MKYLQSTIDLPLVLSADGTGIPQWHIDASYAVHVDMKSHTGGAMTLGKGSMYSTSVKQKLMTRSSTEAEVVDRNLPTSGLGSGSSWLDGVNGILMQQEPDLPKQDYWNRRAIACFPCQHLNHSRGASSYTFTVFYAAATALEMPI
jgi:hypothetical protein